eukprot:2942972-Amphidinium_carterae.1
MLSWKKDKSEIWAKSLLFKAITAFKGMRSTSNMRGAPRSMVTRFASEDVPYPMCLACVNGLLACDLANSLQPPESQNKMG